MEPGASLRFFDAQFRRQVGEADFHLNPFEQLALPFLRGRVLDYGCGLGNLAVAAAARGCSVTALDGSPTAIANLRERAAAAGLAIAAAEADLRFEVLREDYDAIACIGLLMFFDCPTARAQLAQLQARVRPGGVAIVNVLQQGTTYLDMFDPAGHCLFATGELERHFAGWELLANACAEYPAPNGLVKSFATVIARKPKPHAA